MDLKVDMNSSFLHNCPSINFYRLVVLEPLWLRKLFISSGDNVEEKLLMGIFSDDQFEDIGDYSIYKRDVKLSYAGIIHDVEWYDLD